MGQVGIVIDLEDGCKTPHCRGMAQRIGDAMVPDFCEGVAILPVPTDIAEYTAGQERRQLRQRANRADRIGYSFGPIQPRERRDEILEINRSMPERQGRPMADHYINPTNFSLVRDPVCPMHHTYWYGVTDFLSRRLRAYCSWHRCGELLQTSAWIGHGDFNNDGIMYFMLRETMRAQAALGGYAMYHYYDAGGISWNGGGLRQWKKQCGFEKRNVVWV